MISFRYLSRRHMYVIAFLSLAFIHSSIAQVSSDPAFPTDNAQVTIIFDATKGAAGLMGYTGDVYAHTGVITNLSTSASDWKYVKAAWGTTDPNVKMTRDASNANLYRLTITNPRTYYGVPDGEQILKLAFVFRNGDGSKEGKGTGGTDLFINVASGALQVFFTAPTQYNVLVQPNGNITITGVASKSSTLTLFNNASQIAQTSGTMLGYVFNAGTTGQGEIKITANDGTTTVGNTFNYTVQQPPVIQDPPAGTRNGINYISTTSVILQLYAPNKNFVYVTGDFNDWKLDNNYQMKKSSDGNYYWLQIDNLVSMQEYAFQYQVNNSIKTGDPYCDKILDPDNDKYITTITYPNLKPYPTGKTTGIVSVLQTNQPVYNWQVTDFKRPAKEKLVIYELLVRDFLTEQSYQAISDTLTYLKSLGVNAIELMPVTEFTGNNSWGYNPIYYFAPDKAYGTKDALKSFIDKCHQNGIAVIMDIVFNQADYEFPYVKMYWNATANTPSADNPMFNQVATHPYSVFFDFNHKSPDTQRYVDTTLRHWITEYNIDGYRFDLAKGFTQFNSGSNVSLWGNLDTSRVAIWKRIYNKIRTYDDSVYVILEYFADNSEETILANYGMMLWGNMSGSYKQSALGFSSGADASGISYKNRGWNSPNLVGYMESHDEERLMYNQINYGNIGPGYNTKTLQIALQRMKTAAAFMFLVPGPKLLWQFGELGYDKSINYCEDGTINNNCRTNPKPVLWSYKGNADRMQLHDVYAALIKLKTTQSVFSSSDFTGDLSGLVKTLKINDTTMKVYIIGNFDVGVSEFIPSFQQTGVWYDYFTGKTVTVTDTGQKLYLSPGEFHIYTTTKLITPATTLVPAWSEYPTTMPTGIEPEVDREITAHPNPSEDIVYVHLAQNSKKILVKVKTLQGTEIHDFETTSPDFQVDIRNLAPGMYLLGITTEQGESVSKIIKK